MQAITVLAICRKLKYYGTLKCLLTQDHMGLKITNRHSSYSFHSMLVKLHEDIGYHGGIEAVISWQSAKFLNFVTLRNFNIKIIECAIR